MNKQNCKIHSSIYNKLYPIFLLIATFFMGIGYAAINSISLNIEGTAIANYPKGLFISEVNYIESANNENDKSEIIKAYQTTLNSEIVLTEDNPSSYITYNVIIKNNTNNNYRYIETIYDKEFYNNKNITFEISNISYGDKIKSGNSLNIKITFKYIEKVDFTEENFSNILNSFVNFNFELDPSPVLSDNMVPIYYESGNWLKTNKDSDNWHNYLDKKWANALTYKNNIIYNEIENDTSLKVFNGTSDYVLLGNAEYDFGKNITVVARVKLHSYADAESGIVGNPEGAGFYMIKRPNNKFGFEFYDASSKSYKIIDSVTTPQLNTWYTVVGTYDGKTLKIYVNGVLETSMNITSSIKVSPAPIAIGGNPDENKEITGGYFNGAISEVAVITETLTATEIAERYSNIVTHKPEEFNTLYYLKFDADNGIVHNSASYEDEGMLFNGVDDYVNVGYSSYNFNNAVTLAARVKLHSYSDTEYGIIGNPQSAGIYLLKSPNNKFEVIAYNTKISDYVRAEAPNTIELNKWYTVVATCSSSALKIYVNGELAKTVSTTINIKTSNIPFMIGLNPTINSTLGGSYWDGMISDVMIVDEVLTDAQIRNNYSNDFDTVVSNKTLIKYNLEGYQYREDGTTIPEEMINGMWTWIPRFSAVTPTNSGAIDLKLVEQDKSSHDAFTFNNNQLEGFWVGKFENSSEKVDTNILIKPNYTSLKNKNISSAFNLTKNMVTKTKEYGFDTSKNTLIDTHLIKNNEWSSIAYLTQSKYGLCTNGECAELEENSTTYTTGGANYLTNIGQSTTGNVYGVYDMNGGVEEFVMGNYNNTLNSLDGFSSLPDSKYFNIYTTSEDYTLNNFQHAMIETNEIFNNSSSDFVTSSNVWLKRNNLFSYTNTTGEASNNIGSRTILVVKK